MGAAEEASRICKELQDKWKAIIEFVVLIAGMARSWDEALVTRNGHFRSVRGIKLISW